MVSYSNTLLSSFLLQVCGFLALLDEPCLTGHYGLASDFHLDQSLDLDENLVWSKHLVRDYNLYCNCAGPSIFIEENIDAGQQAGPGQSCL